MGTRVSPGVKKASFASVDVTERGSTFGDLAVQIITLTKKNFLIQRRATTATATQLFIGVIFLGLLRLMQLSFERFGDFILRVFFLSFSSNYIALVENEVTGLSLSRPLTPYPSLFLIPIILSIHFGVAKQMRTNSNVCCSISNPVFAQDFYEVDDPTASTVELPHKCFPHAWNGGSCYSFVISPNGSSPLGLFAADVAKRMATDADFGERGEKFGWEAFESPDYVDDW